LLIGRAVIGQVTGSAGPNQQSAIEIQHFFMSWQRKARTAIVLFVVVFAAIVFVALRRRAAAVPQAPPPQRADPSAQVENTGGGHLENTKDGKLTFALDFRSQFSYPDGRTRLGGVRLTSNRNGKAFTVTSDEAEVVQSGQDLKTAHFTKNVKLTSEGTEVTADEGTYDQQAGMMTIPGAVAFRRGRLNGTGVGATYDLNREVLWLLKDARIKVAPDEKGQGAIDASSSAAGMARADHYIKLTGGGHINGEGRVTDADEITILLTEDDQRARMLQLRGNSRITGSAAAGGPQAMSARDIDLTYGNDGQTLQQAKLMENGVVQLPSEGQSQGRRVAGKNIDIALAPDGKTVTSLSATENVQVDLPPDGDAPAKRIRSATLNATGAPDTGLQNATFGGNVDYRETRAARGELPAVDRQARSQTMTVKTKPGFGAIEEADFHGNVHFTDGPDVAADANHALYHVDKDQIDLTPSADPGPAAPRVANGRVTVEARSIEFGLTGRKLKADTKVRSSMQPASAPVSGGATAGQARGSAPASGGATAGQARGSAPASGGATAGQARGSAPVSGGATAGQGRRSAPASGSGSVANNSAADATKVPSLLKNDQPVTVTSNRLEYDGDADHAVYTGNARLWQGDTKINGDTIVVDNKTGNLEAHTNVHTDMMIDDVDPKTNARTPTRSVVDADNLVYDDSKRLATYTGHVHFVGAEGDVRAAKLELFLLTDANELDHAEGYGANGEVIVKETDRVATGARLTYTARNETYLMTGTPVKVVEQKDQDCKESVGAVLTFQRAVDTVDLKGPGGIRTVSKQIACPPGSK
jgi:lipopolysaccharide export system protein LptA